MKSIVISLLNFLFLIVFTTININWNIDEWNTITLCFTHQAVHIFTLCFFFAIPTMFYIVLKPWIKAVRTMYRLEKARKEFQRMNTSGKSEEEVRKMIEDLINKHNLNP